MQQCRAQDADCRFKDQGMQRVGISDQAIATALCMSSDDDDDDDDNSSSNNCTVVLQ